ncbi:Mu-like prophage major head subunit gpT [Tistlia consotensis]|uniref:Mu-like prophage major head subunit gpT n=1 Tax=Tistlia consotensis USBA 355 TaxID=560819 RepID=A0A1Y6CRJ4_9PROT|nr:Mu-like prophage major head subunit gpT family protein [Tistlia consotensis]SMF86154.1 Mu-like prophage major head subunit gpT [Tistlia consotensis USBA 355]SNS43472.1 Mu-like prophage major head subunit gpT [Tistlia consotensis]
MEVNAANLRSLFTGFRTVFNQAFDGATPTWDQVAMLVQSTTSEEQYPWLGELPGIKEWVGDRVIENLTTHDFTIKNKEFELTVGIKRPRIKDDRYGVYKPVVAEMGRAARMHPDQLVWPLLNGGFTSKCYDNQFFFDIDHPVLDEAGAETSVSNMQAGAGPAWFLLDTTRMIKPLIYQEREPYKFVPLQDDTDNNVFMRNEYVYGVDGRSNAGYGLWQLAFGSKDTLDDTNYEAARAAMTGLKGDYGRPLGITPNLLVVGPTNEGAGRRAVVNTKKANGSDNEWAGTAKLLVVPWLA